MARWTTLSEPEVAAKSAKNRAFRTDDVRLKNEFPAEFAPVSTRPLPKASRTRQQSLRKPSKASAPIPTEHEEQVRVIDWWRGYAATHKIPECLLFAIPNGANKSMASAAKFKREGLRKGAPDLFLAVPTRFSHGMAIEMKRTKGSETTRDQFEMRDKLMWRGYDARICKGADEAIDAITRYLA